MEGNKRANLDNTVAGNLITIDKWLDKQLKLGITTFLTAPQCQELHRLGFDPEDLFNGGDVAGTAGVVNVKDPTNLANYLEGFNAIAARSKFGTFRAAFVAHNNHTPAGAGAPDA